MKSCSTIGVLSMPDPFAPSTRFHETTTCLHLYARDVTQLPAPWVAGLALAHEHTLRTNPKSMAREQRQHFSTEAIEACIALIFGRQGLKEVVASLANEHKVGEEKSFALLAELSDRVMVGLPNTASAQDVADMLYTFWNGDGYLINRFVTQANKRLKMH